MEKRVTCCLLILMYLFLACADGKKKETKKFNQKPAFEIALTPQPKFDKTVEELVREYMMKYNTKNVKIGTVQRSSAIKEHIRWLKVEFINPEMNNRTIKAFGREVALNTLKHLVNKNDFEKIEIFVMNRKGFILTFTESRNVFFYVDSLSNSPN